MLCLTFSDLQMGEVSIGEIPPVLNICFSFRNTAAFFLLTQCANAALLFHSFIGTLSFSPSRVISLCPLSVAPSADASWPLLPPAPLRQAPALDRCRCHSASVCCPTLPKSPVEHLCVAAALVLSTLGKVLGSAGICVCVCVWHCL